MITRINLSDIARLRKAVSNGISDFFVTASSWIGGGGET